MGKRHRAWDLGRVTHTSTLTDPKAIPDTGPETWLDRYFLPKLHDARDMAIVRNALALTLSVVPLAVLLFVPGVARWFIAPLYIGYVLARFEGRYILMLHVVAHRPLFRSGHALWSLYIPYLMAPFFGLTPMSYYVHHIGMHHPENNLAADASSTLCYRRDSLWHWLHYWARFFFLGYPHLFVYLWRKQRLGLIRRWVVGEVLWFSGVAIGLYFAPAATLTVFVIPMFLLRVLMMVGNFGQHAFVDLDNPDNGYKNSTNLLNVRYNHKCFNDGYHIVHHLKPALHWTEMSQWYEDHLEEHGAQDAIVFDGLGNNMTVWRCLMTGDWDRLAHHLVELPGRARSQEEKVAFLQKRARRTSGPIKGLFDFSA